MFIFISAILSISTDSHNGQKNILLRKHLLLVIEIWYITTHATCDPYARATIGKAVND